MRTFAVGLAIALAGWSLIANLVVGDHLYVARNLVLAAGLLLLAARRGLRPPELGLARAPLVRGGILGGAAVTAIALAVGFGVLFADEVDAVGMLLGDQRAQLPMGEAVHHAMVRIPFGTALFEEVAFRGVLLAALLRHTGKVAAVTWSSAAFGVWHIGPSIVALEVNAVDPASMAGMLAVTAAVAVTTIAGALFAVLRLASGSLLAPFLAHWATNAFGLLAAAVTEPTGLS